MLGDGLEYDGELGRLDAVADVSLKPVDCTCSPASEVLSVFPGTELPRAVGWTHFAPCRYYVAG